MNIFWSSGYQGPVECRENEFPVAEIIPLALLAWPKAPNVCRIMAEKEALTAGLAAGEARTGPIGTAGNAEGWSKNIHR
jgi:hypothetical protein